VTINRTTHRIYVERLHLKKLKVAEGKEQYHFEIINGFAALENLDTEVDINRAWETIRENRKFHPRRV
jgi:hypothetical protein